MLLPLIHKCALDLHFDSLSLFPFFFLALVIEQTDKGPQTTPLYSGPNREAVVSLPVGDFHVYAEIHEEAEAFAVYDITFKLSIYLPEKEDYDAFVINTNDEARIAQFLTADVRHVFRDG